MPSGPRAAAGAVIAGQAIAAANKTARAKRPTGAVMRGKSAPMGVDSPGKVSAARWPCLQGDSRASAITIKGRFARKSTRMIPKLRTGFRIRSGAIKA
jgi:hypothetical protein